MATWGGEKWYERRYKELTASSETKTMKETVRAGFLWRNPEIPEDSPIKFKWGVHEHPLDEEHPEIPCVVMATDAWEAMQARQVEALAGQIRDWRKTVDAGCTYCGSMDYDWPISPEDEAKRLLTYPEVTP